MTATRSTSRWSRVAALAAWLISGACLADGPDSEARREQRAASLAEMKANSLRFRASVGDDDRSVKLRGEPLLRFNDSARDFSDATIWAWGDDTPAWSHAAAVGGERQKPYSIYLIDVDR